MKETIEATFVVNDVEHHITIVWENPNPPDDLTKNAMCESLALVCQRLAKVGT